MPPLIRSICVAIAAHFVIASNVQSQGDAKPKLADIAIVNAHVLVCDSGMTKASAIAFRGGRILSVGERIEVEPFIGKSTEVIDAKGMTVTPGLTDSHLHLIGLGQSLQMLDLSEADSWEKIESMVVEASLRLPKGTWIEGRGWHQSKWSKLPKGGLDGYPHHQALSLAVPDHPVLLTHASGHACFANQAAMELANVDRNTQAPDGGEILKDPDGNPLGVFRENAQGLIRRAQSRMSEKQTVAQKSDAMLNQLKIAGQACVVHGITSVHDAFSPFATARMLKQFADAGQLPLRMSVMIGEGSQSLEAQMDAHRWIHEGGGFLNVRSVKVSLDGALGPHGAWLLEPYDDLPTSFGLNTVSIEELKKIAILCKEHQWQLCVHAIGDRANREVLNVYEEVLGAEISSDHRWRIEHAQHLSPADIPRFGKMGVIPAMQANHCTSDAIFVPKRLGERRSASGAYAWRGLIDSGAIIPNGTDAPVERVDPRVSLFAAVTRELSNGETFYPNQCMTRKEALLSYTLWPAIASFQEKEMGSLEKGKVADVVIWDTDLLDCKPADLLNAKVVQTFLGGASVYHQEK